MNNNKDYDLNLFAQKYGDTQRQPIRRQPSPQQLMRRRRIKRQRRIMSIAIAVLLALLIFLIVVLCKSCASDSNNIKGLWSIDGVTKLEFVDEENGAMVLPRNRYEFTYRIEENMLYLDYKDESMGNPQYEFRFDGGKLIIKDTVAEYIMTKEKSK